MWRKEINVFLPLFGTTCHENEYTSHQLEMHRSERRLTVTVQGECGFLGRVILWRSRLGASIGVLTRSHSSRIRTAFWNFFSGRWQRSLPRHCLSDWDFTSKANTQPRQKRRNDEANTGNEWARGVTGISGERNEGLGSLGDG